MLLKLDSQQFKILEKKLGRRGLLNNQVRVAERQLHNMFYETLSDMRIGDYRAAGGRAEKPNYSELGMSRVAGTPTKEDIEKYAEVTGGGVLDETGYVCEALMFDTDLMPDRYGSATMNCVVDLYSKYLGRANDFNHSFNAKEAICRVIDLNIGTDDGTKLHKDHPTNAKQNLSPMNPYNGTYMALTALLAFPGDTAKAQEDISRVKSSLTRDISIATVVPSDKSFCSECLSPMDRFWFWSYCEEHGFPGGSTEAGSKVVELWDGADDAFVFGFVSDGAVRRACTVLNPYNKQS